MSEKCAQVIALIEDGMTQRYTAEVMDVSRSIVLERHRTTNSNQCKDIGSVRKRKKDAIQNSFANLKTLQGRHVTSI